MAKKRNVSAAARAVVRDAVEEAEKPKEEQAQKKPVMKYRIRYIGKKAVKRFVAADGTEYAIPKGGSVLVPEKHAVEMLRHPDIFRPWTKDTLPEPMLAQYERAMERFKAAAAMAPPTVSEDPHAHVTRAELERVVAELSKRITALEEKLGAS